MLFDTHAHYDDERFDGDREALLAGMPEKNVGLIVNPGCDISSSRRALTLYTPLWASTRKTAGTLNPA